MVVQYPYILEVKTVTGGSFNADGDPIPGTPTFVPAGQCRDEANTGGKFVTLASGQAHVYEALIQLPRTAPDVAIGAEVRVMQGLNVRVSGTAKGFRRDQMHCRLWV